MLQEVLLVFIGIWIVVRTSSLEYESWGNGKIGSSLEGNNSKSNDTICNAEECQTLAKYILSGMNKSVDPCDDFHGYVCGSWSTNYPIPADWYAWSLWEMAKQKIRIFLKEILQEEPKSEDSLPLTLEKKWFQACMDEDRIEQKGLEPLMDIIEKIGGWPIAMNVSRNYNVPWQEVAKYYAKISGGYSLFNIILFFDIPNNSSVQTLLIDQPRNSLIYKWALSNKFKAVKNKAKNNDENDDELHTILSLLYDDDEEDDVDDNYNDNDNHDKNEIVDHIKKIVYNYAEATGEKPKNVSRNIFKLLKFEESLKEIQNLRSEVEVPNTKISAFQEFYNLENLENATSRIDWLEMVQVLFEDTGIEIDRSQNITVRKRSYFHKLAQLLNRTPNRIIVDYIHWSFVQDVLKYLDKKTRQWITDKDNAAYGIKKELERWEHCIKKMPIVEGISYEFVKVHFSDIKKENIASIVEEIRNEIDSEISNTSWMDEETKSTARSKLKTLRIKIGYPEWYKEEEMFSNYYYGLKVGPDYFTNFMNYLKFIKWKTLKDFREPLSKENWPEAPITINALYFIPGNVMFYLAGVSLSPLYNPKAPMALRYGFSGFIIGHEISHVFAYKSFFYNEHGYLRTPLPFKVYRKIANKTLCFIDQYQKYKVNGALTAGENMADGGGLIAAFNVYKKKIIDEKVIDTKLPGLEELNGNQLFFVSFAAAFCQTATPEYLEKNKDDKHASSQVRINGAVSNSEGFSEAFNCPKTSPLNRDQKCIFWSEK